MAVVVQSEGVAYGTAPLDAHQVNQQLEIVNLLSGMLDTHQANQQLEQVAFEPRLPDAHGSNVRPEGVRYIITSLTQGVNQSTVNRVWDQVLGGHVWWATEEIDVSGAHYPGPGDFETQTTDFRVETVKFTRI